MKKGPTNPIQGQKHRAPREKEPFSAIRLASKLTAEIDKWGEANRVTSRSEAIRRLLELGLAASQPLRRRNLEAASKALDLAALELDKLIDPSTSDEERKMRKRRLLRGPKEFRDMRGDVSKSNR
jgi:Arc/MetJ-type ribon-helix-helix transcriptional regulator